MMSYSLFSQTVTKFFPWAVGLLDGQSVGRSLSQLVFARTVFETFRLFFCPLVIYVVIQ